MTTSPTTTQITSTPLAVGLGIVWTVVALVAVVLYLTALPARFEALRQADGTALYALSGQEAALLAQYSVPLDTYAGYMLAFEVVQASAFAVVAVWLYARRPRDRMAVFTSLTLIVTGLIAPATTSALIVGGQAPVLLAAMQIVRYLLTMVFVYVFPDGRFVPPSTRYTALAWGAAILNVTVFSGSNPQTWPAVLQVVAVLLWIGPSLSAQVYRYRRISTAQQRQQTLWFVYAIAIMIGVTLVRTLLEALLPALRTPGEVRLLWFTLVIAPIFDTVGFIVLPLVIAASVVKHQLYGLSLAVNRSLVYGTVVIGLGFAFFLGFFLLQGLVQLVGGSTSLALVVATGIAAALFNPVRFRVQRFIDRRFFGLRVDLHRLEAKEAAQFVAPPDAPRTDASGTRLGVYELGDVIGEGGMGRVYRARHTLINREVAIKVLSETLTDEATFRARFENEARAVALLRHPNIVQLYDYGVAGSTFYMVMEYIVGQDLGALLKRGGALPYERACPIVHGIASALDYAHACGLVHRDVKPANVMLRADEQPVLMDFGIAKFQEETTGGLTRTGMVGTVEYAAPEQIMSARSVDARADIYALGVLTYHMVTGEPPFRGSVGAVVFSHLQQPAPDPRVLAFTLPDHAAFAIQRALAKDPTDRYDTAGEFAQAFA